MSIIFFIHIISFLGGGWLPDRDIAPAFVHPMERNTSGVLSGFTVRLSLCGLSDTGQQVSVCGVEPLLSYLRLGGSGASFIPRHFDNSTCGLKRQPSCRILKSSLHQSLTEYLCKNFTAHIFKSPLPHSTLRRILLFYPRIS